MYIEPTASLRLQEPAALNLSSRINAALDAVDLGLQRAKRPILTTKFGPQSAVLLHLVTQVRPSIPVIWVDTGYNTAATRAFATQIVSKLDLNLKTYAPDVPWNGAVPATDDPQRDAFAEHVKLEPFRRALEEQHPDVWVTALRREQTEFRDGLSLFQKAHGDILKVCPLLDWRDEDMTAVSAAAGTREAVESRQESATTASSEQKNKSNHSTILLSLLPVQYSARALTLTSLVTRALALCFFTDSPL